MIFFYLLGDGFCKNVLKVKHKTNTCSIFVANGALYTICFSAVFAVQVFLDMVHDYVRLCACTDLAQRLSITNVSNLCGEESPWNVNAPRTFILR